MSTFLAGFVLSLSFILAIGAQNVFVLRQGLRQEHILLCVLVCAISDAILISVGVAGFGTISETVPWFGDLMRYGGAIFLFVYGTLAFRSALRGAGTINVEAKGRSSWRSVLSTLLAITWLNPHVYLDTVVLLGSISAQYDSRTIFAFGAISASTMFFFGLGYGAQAFAPLFQKPRAWQIMDVIVGLIMWSIAAGLVIS